MLIEPSSTIELYSNIPINKDRQIAFKNRQEQSGFFQKHLVTRVPDCTYVRREGYIKIERPVSQVLQCNYLSFRNPAFENKIFYARIVDFVYINNTTAGIMFTIDYFQTFFSDVEYHQALIQREHLTEAEYQKTLANPWDRSIPEMFTEENLPVGPTLEKMYVLEEPKTEAVEQERMFIPPKSTYSGTLCLCLCLSPIDNTQLSDWQTFLNFFDGRLADEWRGNVPLPLWFFYLTLDGTTEADIQAKLLKYEIAIKYLTVNDLISSIVGVYLLPRWMFAPEDENHFGATYFFYEKIKPLSVKNPKLNTFPFRYVRVETPKDTKEYQIELFNGEFTEGLYYLPFHMFASLGGVPVIGIAPKNYRQTTEMTGAEEYNYYERIEYNDFPQMALCTDAFLTALAGQYSASLMTTTVQENNMNIQRDIINANDAMGFIGAVTGVAGNVVAGVKEGGYIQEGMAGATTLTNYTEIAYRQNELSRRNLNERQNVLNYAKGDTGQRMNDAVVSNFANSRRAYAAANYRPGASGGYIQYAFNKVGFTVTIATLRDDILKKYDEYLSLFGYASQRVKKPNICDYLKGGTNIPHFEQTGDGIIHYTQTAGMEVTGIYAEACAAIEELFNGGCRFLKGDELQ